MPSGGTSNMPTNYMAQFLRNQGGIYGTAGNDPTKAQLEEKNKLSPLSGYGFMSAQEKAARAQQNAMYEAAMQREQEMMQQQLLARMSSHQQLGHYAGAGLMGLMNALRNRGQGQEAPQGPPKDDPEVARYNELLGQGLPEDTALEMLGNELGNGSMIADSQTMRAARQKQELEMKNTQSQITERENKENPVVTLQKTGPNGEPMQVSAEITGKTKDGRNIYIEKGEAVKGSITGTSRGDFTMTKAQGGEQLGKFEAQMTAAENYLDTSDKMIEIANKAQAGPGFALALAGQANNLVRGFENIKNILGDQLDAKAKANLMSEDPVQRYGGVFNKIRGAAGWDAQLKALLIEQAYLKATANGQRATDQDVKNALETIGGSLNDPKIFRNVIAQDRDNMVGQLMNASKNSGGANKSLAEVYPDRLKAISDRRKYKPKTVRMMKGGKSYNIPVDEADAAEAKGYTRG
jgi:hypothetical protein